MTDKEKEEILEFNRESILQALEENGLPRSLFECTEEQKKQLEEFIEKSGVDIHPKWLVKEEK